MKNIRSDAITRLAQAHHGTHSKKIPPKPFGVMAREEKRTFVLDLIFRGCRVIGFPFFLILAVIFFSRTLLFVALVLATAGTWGHRLWHSGLTHEHRDLLKNARMWRKEDARKGRS